MIDLELTKKHINAILDEYERMKLADVPKEIGMIRLQIDNWIYGMEITKQTGYWTDHDNEHLELLKVVRAILGRIKADGS